MPDVTMPRLSDSMEEGTILKWLVSDGDEVSKGQEIVEIETDKANMTYEADAAGVISFVASEGDTLALGEVIARIGEGDDSGDSGQQTADSGDEDEAEEDSEDSGQQTADSGDDDEAEEDSDNGESDEKDSDEDEPESDSDDSDEDDQEDDDSGDDSADEGGRVKASPVAKRLADEKGVDIASVEGSGPGGRIVKADVEAAADGGDAEDDSSEEAESAPAEAGPKGQTKEVELTRLQRTVSRRMAESKATAPDYTLSVEVDMTECVELRAKLKEETEGSDDPAPSYNDMIVKAAGLALKEFPRVNGAYRDGRFELYSRVNVGIAVAAQDALVVPTIFDADQKSLGQVSRDARGLIEKVRDGKITPPELSGGTFTVSNLGMYGIDSFTAVINPPQAGILTVGSMKKRPAYDEDSDRIVGRNTVWLNLVSDHRILYGADGAEFLARVRELIESPLQLAL